MLNFDELSNRVIGLALEIHKQLGLGLLENTYKLRALRVLRGKHLFHCSIFKQE